MEKFHDYTGLLSDEVRLRFSKRLRERPTGCVEWVGAWSVYVHDRLHKPHRVSYALNVNPVIPAGLSVHRSCSNRRCVAPNHLFVGSKALPVSLRLSRFINKMPGLGPNGDCHEWTGHIREDGYGSFALPSGKTTAAHRAAFECFSGNKVPQGLQVLHHCDNKRCCNPEHLYAGTHLQNMADREERNSAYHLQGSDHPNARLTEDQIRSIRGDGRTQTQIALEYGIRRSMVSMIKSRKRWGHVPD